MDERNALVQPLFAHVIGQQTCVSRKNAPIDLAIPALRHSLVAQYGKDQISRADLWVRFRHFLSHEMVDLSPGAVLDQKSRI